MPETFRDKFIRLTYVYADLSNCTMIINSAARRLTKMCKSLQKNTDEAKELIDFIIESEHVCAKLWISRTALDMNYRRDEVIDMLKSIAYRNDVGHMSTYAFLRLVDFGIWDFDFIKTLNNQS